MHVLRLADIDDVRWGLMRVRQFGRQRTSCADRAHDNHTKREGRKRSGRTDRDGPLCLCLCAFVQMLPANETHRHVRSLGKAIPEAVAMAPVKRAIATGEKEILLACVLRGRRV
jgi:hypothetical protein